MSDIERFSSKGMIVFLTAFFNQTNEALAQAEAVGDQEEVEAIKAFYLSRRCQRFVELSGFSYEVFLETKGLKERSQKIETARRAWARWRRAEKKRAGLRVAA